LAGIEPFTVFEFLRDLYPKGVRALRRVFKRLAFRWQERHPPLDDKRAFDAAFSVLGGQIEQCVAFRNIDSNRTFIAVVRASEHGLKEIYLLEELGLTFRRIWSNEKTIGLKTFTVDDMDGDGNKEIVFEEASYGTGGGTKVLSVYSHSKRKLVRISWRAPLKLSQI
jgi:hypothetical protein